jgi:molybdopterin-guanine dinucleotide biosynthesis protein A
MDATKITGIILAAGYGSRFGYKEKYLMVLDDLTFLERNLLNFRSLGIT